LGLTIFSLVVASLYTTFRVGMKSYEIGQKEINRMQHTRVIFETVSRDLRSVYYLPETAYNKNLRQALNKFRQEMMKAEMQGHLEEFLYGEDDEDDGTPNPYEVGIEIDLNFKGENNDQMDSMTFVRYQYNDGITGIQPWGLGRITYQLEEDELVRLEEDVIEPMKDIDGTVIEEKIPRRDVLARGVTKFDLHYGFFYNEDWMEAEDWDSQAKRYRNPAMEIDEEDPDYQDKLKKEEMKPKDGLPAFVRIDLDIQDFDEREMRKGSQKKDTHKKKKGKSQSFTTLVRIPPALENYLPSLEEEEEDEY